MCLFDNVYSLFAAFQNICHNIVDRGTQYPNTSTQNDVLLLKIVL